MSIDYDVETVEYGELEDALGWIVESPFRLGADPNGQSGPDILVAAAKALHVNLHDLGEFHALGFTRILNGHYGLNVEPMNYLLGDHYIELGILLGIAAARGKCPGP